MSVAPISGPPTSPHTRYVPMSSALRWTTMLCGAVNRSAYAIGTVVMLASSSIAGVGPIAGVIIAVPSCRNCSETSARLWMTPPGVGHDPSWMWAGWGVMVVCAAAPVTSDAVPSSASAAPTVRSRVFKGHLHELVGRPDRTADTMTPVCDVLMTRAPSVCGRVDGSSPIEADRALAQMQLPGALAGMSPGWPSGTGSGPRVILLVSTVRTPLATLLAKRSMLRGAGPSSWILMPSRS